MNRHRRSGQPNPTNPMSSISAHNDSKQNRPPHESGAIAAWCALAGVAVSAIIGLVFGHFWIAAIMLGSMGWIIGALIERLRR